MRIPVVGQTYESRSVAADAQRTINFYPERVESGQGKASIVLYPTPGLKPFATLPDYPVRGEFAELGRAFVVAGGTLYELFTDGTFVVRGSVANDAGVVTMRTNGHQGHQLFVVSGFHGYILDLNTNVFTPLEGVGAFPTGEVISGTFLDGYFIAVTSTGFQISALFDGLSWDGLDTAIRSIGADPIVIGLQNHRELWLWGEVTTEVWYNTGADNFPFAPIQGVFIEMGCSAAHTAVRFDNQVLWLSRTRDGDRIAVLSAQYTPQRISTHAVEMAWRRYDRVSDAIAFAYQEDGHTFYQITFPSAGHTWVFDMATKMWHERAFWNVTVGEFEAHRAIAHCRAFDKHLVGDRQTGKVYEWSLRYALDDGAMIRRMRRLPHISKENRWLFYPRLEIELETGLPLMPDGVQVRDPMVMIRWSDDRGHTWSSEQWASAGRTGAYMARVYFLRLGRSRDRTFEITVDAQIPWRLTDGYLDVQEGMH